MAIVYYYGDVPVEKSEALEKLVIGDLKNLSTEYSLKEKQVNFREGTVSLSEIKNNEHLDLPDFTPIGIGKPLSVEILCSYVGDAPRKFPFLRNADIMTVSGVKSYVTYGAAPKAINHIRNKVKDHSYLRFGAFDEGSPIVYYTPAVDASTTFCSFALVADTFDEGVFSMISRLFTAAAGLPVFAPASPFLLAGSTISGMIGNLGKAIFESKPFMQEDEEFRFDTPVVPISTAKQLLICNDSDLTELKAYKPGLTDEGDENPKPALIHRQKGHKYTGDAPYMLVNIDGKKRSELDSFTPKIATAAILEKYYGTKDQGSAVSDALETAMKLYNDFNYYNKAKSLKEDMEGLDKDSEEYLSAKKLLEAYQSNIKSDHFKS